MMKKEYNLRREKRRIYENSLSSLIGFGRYDIGRIHVKTCQTERKCWEGDVRSFLVSG